MVGGDLERRYIPPWREPYLIGIAGCSGSGKTSIASSVQQKLNVPWTILLSMDNFYKPLTQSQRELAFQSKYDFDSPDSIDIDLLVEVLRDLKKGKKVLIPTYSFELHNRTNKWLTVYGANVIIIEGLYALYDPRILELLDLKVFVDTAFDICLARRLNRDILHRGREVLLSIQQWDRFVKPNYERHIRPTMRNADILIPRGLDNTVGINMLSSNIQKQLAKKSSQHISDFLALTGEEEITDGRLRKRKSLSDTVIILNQTPQIQAIHTILFDYKTPADDFIFYFDRMAGIIINRALDEFTQCCDLNIASPKTIQTPNGYEFRGISLPFDNICAVTIIRGGECFNTALRSTIPNIRLGRILLQSDSRTGEARLHTMALPPCIDPKPDGPSGDISEQTFDDLNKTHVLLVDSQISSGAATTMAVAILTDHGVKQENITCISYVASEIGLRRLSYAHPKVKIVVGRIEKTVANHYLDTLYYRT